MKFELLCSIVWPASILSRGIFHKKCSWPQPAGYRLNAVTGFDCRRARNVGNQRVAVFFRILQIGVGFD